ncbi:uncharacterized protein K452DRAFT_346841, partial [Aplosporella prunicola CBS 121167]
KTPFKFITGEKPDLLYTRTYSYKAFTLIKYIPRLQKLTERAYIRHLVSYNLSNIFRI